MMPSTSAPRVQHVADGNIAEFNFDFVILQSGDLEVLLDTSVLIDGFTVQGGYPSNGGTVAFAQAPAAGTVVTLQRRLPIERTTDLRPSAACVANTLNEEFDRLVQQVDENTSRAVRAGATDADANMLLPAREARAGRILGFDEAGDVTTLAASLPEFPDLDAIPEGVNNKHFTSMEKAKLAGIEPGSEANPAASHGRGEGQRLGARAALLCAARRRRHGAGIRDGGGGQQRLRPHRRRRRADRRLPRKPDHRHRQQVMMTSAERAKLAGFVTVTDFGAVGDGATDDTSAFQAAAAYVVQKKKALRVPAGTYLLKQTIAFANAPVALLGDGIRLSILKWAADATSLGISIASNADTQFHLIRDLSFYVAKKGGTAITLDYTGQVNSVSFPGKKLTLDRSSPRFLVENCFFRGAALLWDTGWDVGIDSIAAIKGSVLGCSFTGWQTGSPPTANIAFRFRGIDASFENGHPCEFLVKACSVYNTETGVVFDGCEGVLSKTAIWWVCSMESLLRMASVAHSSMCQTVI